MHTKAAEFVIRLDHKPPELNLHASWEIEEPISPGTPSLRLQKYFKRIPTSQLKEELQIILWRSKTEFPVVKVLSFKHQQDCHDVGFSSVQLVLENCSQTLADLFELTMGQLLYLMKESAAGFQRLYAKIGGFQITKKTVYINKKQKCKIWFSEKVEDNVKINETQLTQQSMLQQFLGIFSEKSKVSSITRKLFLGLQKVETWRALREQIEKFQEENKVKVPSKFNSNMEKNLFPCNLLPIPRSPPVNLPRKKMPTFMSKMADKNGASLPSFDEAIVDSPSKLSLHNSGYSTNYKDNSSPDKTNSMKQSSEAIASLRTLAIRSDDETKSQWSRSPDSSPSPEYSDPNHDSFGFHSQQFFAACKVEQKPQEKGSMISLKKESGSPKKFIHGLFEHEEEDPHESQSLRMRILQKNGWECKLNGLMSDVNDDLALSRHIGQDQMSEHMMYSQRDLCLLGKLGGELKTSMIFSNES